MRIFSKNNTSLFCISSLFIPLSPVGRSIGSEPVLLSFGKEEYLQAVGRELLVYNGLLVGMRTARPQRRRKMACYSADGRPYGQRAGLSCVPGGPIRLFPRVALKCNFDGGVSSGVLPAACRGGHDRPSPPVRCRSWHCHHERSAAIRSTFLFLCRSRIGCRIVRFIVRNRKKP